MVKKSTRNAPTCARCLILEKHIKRLERRIAKLTATKGEKSTKQIFFDEKAIAIRLNLSVKTLQNWRGKGNGPKPTKIGRSVRYRLRDIIAYEKSLPMSDGNFQ